MCKFLTSRCDDEMVPDNPRRQPTKIRIALRINNGLDISDQKSLMWKAQGRMMQIPILTREPVRLRTNSKYGTERASARITRSNSDPMLPRTIVFVLVLIERGRLRSSCIANGANSRAYLVIGVITVAQIAILVTMRLRGMLRVIWEFTSLPNILAPMNAKVVYSIVTSVKLTMDTFVKFEGCFIPLYISGKTI